jgi:8-oxo-dGTP pyrophosphatase MutT (NUDIX family)
MQFFIHRYSIVVQEDTDIFGAYHHIIDAKQIAFSNSLFKGLSGSLLLVNIEIDYFKQLLLLLDKNEQIQIQKIFVLVEDLEEFKKTLREQFEVVNAAGGLVRYRDKCLMIFRRGKWDLPKGKIDEGEDAQAAALREIAEECNIEAIIEDKLCSTWHHYWLGGKIILKKTKWYLMTTHNPESIKPQVEEDIEQIIWMDTQEVRKALENSFSSIEYVIEKFYDLSKQS